MSYALRHAGKVSDKGELTLLDPLAWRGALAKHKGREVYVTVVRKSVPHSDNQRKYYFGVVVDMIASHIGESRDETHELLKALHLSKRSIELLDGKHLDMPATTRTLSVEEFATYLDRVIQWAAIFLGLSIPSPGEVEVRL